MTTTKNRTNRTRAARSLAKAEPSLTYLQALQLLTRLMPANTPLPDVSDAAVRADLLTRWRQQHPAAFSGYVYLACYDGFSLEAVAVHGSVEIHALGSEESPDNRIAGLPSTAAAGQLYVWFEPQTYAAECYRAGQDVDVVSHDWSLLSADMRSAFADAEDLHVALEQAFAELVRLREPAPAVFNALLADAIDVANTLSTRGGTSAVCTSAANWLVMFSALQDGVDVTCRHCEAVLEPDGEAANGWTHRQAGGHAGGPACNPDHTLGNAHTFAVPDVEQCCEVDDCMIPADACHCGAWHCPIHPHIS